MRYLRLTRSTGEPSKQVLSELLFEECGPWPGWHAEYLSEEEAAAELAEMARKAWAGGAS